MIRGLSIISLLVLVESAVVSCGSDRHLESESSLSLLRVAVLPDESTESVQNRYTPLLDAISAYIGIPYELVVVESYEELVDAVVRGDADLANFGGYSYVLAREKAGVVALVQRDLDTRFTSYFVARAGEDSARISDFQGRVMSFGSQLSTSGHIMPRLFLAHENISPEDYFGDVLYSGAHDVTVMSVVNGEADLGAVNAQLFESMLSDGRVSPDAIRVIAVTPPYANYVWAVHPSVSPDLRIDIRDAFLSFSSADETHRSILNTFGARTFLPANDSDYKELREAVRIIQTMDI